MRRRENVNFNIDTDQEHPGSERSLGSSFILLFLFLSLFSIFIFHANLFQKMTLYNQKLTKIMPQVTKCSSISTGMF